MIDTIFARATAAGRAAVAIVRVTGPGAAEVLEALAGGAPPPRQAAVRRLRSRNGEVIDTALVLWMPGPGSFTGEDSVELQVHGGPVILQELHEALTQLGLRAAQPGEFSRRAFTNGRMDLLQAEAIADLVDAETSAQKRQALLQMSGGVGRRFERWRDALADALALIEAENDFPDEDLPGALAEQARPMLESVTADLELALAAAARGQRVRNGYRVAVIGRPNAGKSSLFNALVGREAAIVSQRPGTTRDIVEAEVQVGGYAVTLADTAGVRDAADEIESEGVRRARQWADSAAWRLLIVDASDSAGLQEVGEMVQPDDLVVVHKSDLTGSPASEVPEWASRRGLTTLRVSSKTGEGLDALRARLEARLVSELGGAEAPSATRARHQEAMEIAHASLVRANAVLTRGSERAAEDVRIAARALQSVIGGVDNEAVLDRVFSAFCIGK
ncbi:MAG: tRNA uridine-5-carboxymethylaminomethyl(34) synthesis GTPase MnmE [Proteobacteria bacterium]|nr:tRNA uridine-5-carboxymethylaminomethyl(34) synthesis GTPase MnmE [Pseudomonadota bacterium]